MRQNTALLKKRFKSPKSVKTGKKRLGTKMLDIAAGSDQFWNISYGYLASSVLFSALEFDLFTLLDRKGKVSREELVQILKVQDQPLRVLLVGLVNLGLLGHSTGRYFCSPLAKKMLSLDSSDNVVPVLKWHYHIVYRGMFHLTTSIRTGKNEGLVELPGNGSTLYERLAGYPELEKIFQDAMSCISGRVRKYFLDRLPWRSMKHVVDLGGGDGTNARAIAGRYTGLRTTVFDLPSVCNIARGKLAGSPLAERVNVIPGNFITDPLPPADCYLLAHICPIYSEKTIRGIFEKAHATLPAGGNLVVYTMMGDDDHSQHLPAALGSAYFLTVATGEGMIYPSVDYIDWLKASGFSQIKRIDLPYDQVCLVATK